MLGASPQQHGQWKNRVQAYLASIHFPDDEGSPTKAPL
jgi:hypothetical protein